LDDLVEEGSND